MAENRCPMCGEINPEDLEVCQYCGARLTPLILSNSATDSENDLEHFEDLFGRKELQDSTDQQRDERDINDEVKHQDWLDNLRADTGYQDESSLPDEMEDDKREANTQPDNEDWLQRIRSLHRADQLNTSNEETNYHFEDSDELDIYDDSREEENSEKEDWQDILHRLRSMELVGKEQKDRGSEGIIPEWLNDKSALEDKDEEVIPGSEIIPETDSDKVSEDKNVEDWLSELISKDDSDEPLLDNEEDQVIPDWLLDPDDEQLSRLEESESRSAVISEGDEEGLPDWLSKLNAGQSIDTEHDEKDIESQWLAEQEDVPKRTELDNEIPSWLADLDDPVHVDDDIASHEIDVAIHDKDEKLFDWISGIDKDDKIDGDQTTNSFSEIEEDLPEWLRKLEESEPEPFDENLEMQEKTPSVSPFLGAELDDEKLLQGETASDWFGPEDEDQIKDLLSDEALAPADIPGWLTAIRPVDDKETVDRDSGGDLEVEGPLAGLQGILPAKPGITQIKTPPAYSTRIRITETQQNQINIIRKMLEEEGKEEPIPVPSLLSPQRTFRWIIGFLLILGMSLLILIDGQFFPIPDINGIPGDILDTTRIISTLADQKPSLIAFDYQPGMSGEMHAVSAALIHHLILKGSKLTLISTLPTGPAIGEYFIQNIQSEHNYIRGEDYINLGFIPGGASGLFAFSQTPQLIIQQSLDGGNPWDSNLLLDIDSLSDFSVIVVITDNAEIAQTWVEQVQPRIGETPLIMAVSAQVEPVVRPYATKGSGGQVAGIVSGISGGAAYELVIGKANLGREYWDAFSFGLIIILLVIIIGGAVNLYRYYRFNNESKERTRG